MKLHSDTEWGSWREAWLCVIAVFMAVFMLGLFTGTRVRPADKCDCAEAARRAMIKHQLDVYDGTAFEQAMSKEGGV